LYVSRKFGTHTGLWRAAGNVATVVFIPLALIASMVGIASVLAGAHHVRVWRSESLAAASATSLISWLLTLLAMGLACKEIHTGYGRSKRLVSLFWLANNHKHPQYGSKPCIRLRTSLIF